MQSIAKRLLEKNPALAEAMASAGDKEQYKTAKGFLTGRLMAKIGQAENKYVKAHDLAWAIVDEYNGNSKAELDY